MAQLTLLSRADSSGQGLGIGSRIFLTLFCLVFGGMGCFFLYAISKDILKGLEARSWPTVPCVIRNSDVGQNDKNNDYRFFVSYSYTYDNQKHRGDVYQIGYKGSSHYADAQKLTRRYPAGSQQICRVNPKNPAEAVLETKSLWSVFGILFPLPFIAIGLGGLHFTWFKMKAKSDAPRIKSKEMGPKKLAVFFSIFGLFGLGLLIPFFVLPLVHIYQARNWTETPCWIVSSSVRSHRGDKSTTYSVDILYSYRVDGQELRSNRYSFMSGSSSGYSGKQAIVEKYPPGSRSVCYVDPSDPGEAVLNRGFDPMMWAGLIPLVFVIVGGVGVFFSLRSARKAKLSKAPQWLPQSAAVPANAYEASRPLTLQPQATPVGKVIGIIFFACIWNGLVSVFVYKLITDWQRGSKDYCLGTFLVPFVLIGLGAIVAIFYQLLALANPRVRLILGRSALRPGEETDLQWEFAGKADRLSRLTIVLEGREEATYSSGKSSSTATSTFANIEIVETRSFSDMRRGQRRFAIPAGTMHSFKSSHNKITWVLIVHGEISNWPDVKEEFEITVLPAKALQAAAQEAAWKS